MKLPRSAEPLGYLLLTLLTCASLAFQHYRRGDREEDEAVMYASRLKVGTAFPALHLRPLSGAAAAGGEGAPRCRVYVVFHPRCVHCGTAAARERVAAARPGRLPVTWISGFADADAHAFAGRIAPSSRLLFDPDAHRALKVNGIPAAFLVSGGGELRYFWVYRGDEDHRRLARRC